MLLDPRPLYVIRATKAGARHVDALLSPYCGTGRETMKVIRGYFRAELISVGHCWLAVVYIGSYPHIVAVWEGSISVSIRTKPRSSPGAQISGLERITQPRPLDLITPWWPPLTPLLCLCSHRGRRNVLDFHKLLHPQDLSRIDLAVFVVHGLHPSVDA